MSRLPVVVAVESDSAAASSHWKTPCAGAGGLAPRPPADAQSTLTELAADRHVAVVALAPPARSRSSSSPRRAASRRRHHRSAAVGRSRAARGGLARAGAPRRRRSRRSRTVFMVSSTPTWPRPMNAPSCSSAPSTARAAERAADWLADRLHRTTSVDEVTLTSSDDWELHGTRWLPHGTTPGPGIVLLHSGRSDRAVFARLERLLAERGFAVLNLDWRGRGRSTNRGTYMALGADERAAGWRDAAAAFDHLAALPGVDARATRRGRRDPRCRARRAGRGRRWSRPRHRRAHGLPACRRRRRRPTSRIRASTCST